MQYHHHHHHHHHEQLWQLWRIKLIGGVTTPPVNHSQRPLARFGRWRKLTESPKATALPGSPSRRMFSRRNYCSERLACLTTAEVFACGTSTLENHIKLFYWRFIDCYVSVLPHLHFTYFCLQLRGHDVLSLWCREAEIVVVRCARRRWTPVTLAARWVK